VISGKKILRRRARPSRYASLARTRTLLARPRPRPWQEQKLHVRAVKGDGRAAMMLAERYIATFRPELREDARAMLERAYRRGCQEAGLMLCEHFAGYTGLGAHEEIDLMEAGAAAGEYTFALEIAYRYGGIVEPKRLKRILEPHVAQCSSAAEYLEGLEALEAQDA
jgi:hypothetical protein